MTYLPSKMILFAFSFLYLGLFLCLTFSCLFSFLLFLHLLSLPLDKGNHTCEIPKRNTNSHRQLDLSPYLGSLFFLSAFFLDTNFCFTRCLLLFLLLFFRRLFFCRFFLSFLIRFLLPEKVKYFESASQIAKTSQIYRIERNLP